MLSEDAAATVTQGRSAAPLATIFGLPPPDCADLRLNQSIG